MRLVMILPLPTIYIYIIYTLLFVTRGLFFLDTTNHQCVISTGVWYVMSRYATVCATARVALALRHSSFMITLCSLTATSCIWRYLQMRKPSKSRYEIRQNPYQCSAQTKNQAVSGFERNTRIQITGVTFCTTADYLGPKYELD